MVYALRYSTMLFMAALLLLLGRRLGREEPSDKYRFLRIGSCIRRSDAADQFIDAID